MQPVQSRKFSKFPLLLFAFGLIVSLAGCTQPPPPKADVVVAEPPARASLKGIYCQDLKTQNCHCQKQATHTYCRTKKAPATPPINESWGAISNYSPEVFCAYDLPVEVCEGVTSALLAATKQWGNYGPLEYWVLGSNPEAGKALTEINCNRRITRGQRHDINRCYRKHGGSGSHGFEDYRRIGAESVDSGRPSGSAGLNGNRHWGIHYFTSSIPVGFLEMFKMSVAHEQQPVFHEYFHAVQHAHIYTKNSNKRNELLGPVWFNEGGAEYMGLVTLIKSFKDGSLNEIKENNRHPFVFREKMEHKKRGGLKKLASSKCSGLKMQDLTYRKSCDGAYYDLGTWAHAYLAHKHGSEVLLETFYPNLEELGWEGAFVKTYGMTSEEFYAEFEQFLELPNSQQMAILP
jgi:hypothetical protein